MEIEMKNKPWRDFVFEDIFIIESTSSGIDRNKLVNKKGLIPYLTRSERNNGYDSLICVQDGNYKTDEANVITVGLDTQTVFYQPYKFYTGQNIQVLKCRKLNKHIALFLIPLIKRQMVKFNWGGNGATLSRLRRSKLLLPVDQNGEPDYIFMETSIKLIEHKKNELFVNYIKRRIKKLESFKAIDPIEEKRFAEFEIGKLFTLSQGRSKGLNHLVKIKNGINYLGATSLNNGVLCQVEKVENLIHPGNAIAFIRNGEGSMGYSVYKEEAFVATSDISVGYNSHLNREIGLFITTVADKVRGKYNFGYKRSEKRLMKERILLPVTDKNEPNYEYMENYMKQIEFNKLKEYLLFKQRLNS